MLKQRIGARLRGHRLLIAALALTVLGGCPMSDISDMTDMTAMTDKPTISAISPASGPLDGGTPVTISGEGFAADTAVTFGADAAIQVTVLNSQLIQTVSPPAAGPGTVSVMLISDTMGTASMAGGFNYLEEEPPARPAPEPEPEPEPEPIDPGDLPRVVSAVATSTTSVIVEFSKPMGKGAEVATNYYIRGTGSAFLIVQSATLRAGDPSIVDLVTLSQAADMYTVSVTGVKDTFGQNLASPSGIETLNGSLDPTEALFAGIPPGSLPEHIDTDGDGFADWFEMTGWDITITTENGETSTVQVTSNPFNPDTDGDGLTDAQENANGFDPRTDDTDADLVLDPEELNEWFSDATNQDTDGDGINDYREITLFKTSPILADTDGDQWTDKDELFFRNRNPRVSDIPIPEIKVGTMQINLKEIYSYTDEMGMTQEETQDRSTTLGQSESRTRATSDTRSAESTDQFSQEIGTEFTIGGQDPFGGFSINATVGFEQTRQRGYSYSIDSESGRESSQEHQEAVSYGTSLSNNKSVTRTVEDADLLIDITIGNLGDVAFTISDLELSAFVRDPVRKENVPLATLLSERELGPSGEAQQYNLGPFDVDRGPFIFKDIQMFPNVADELRKNPRAVTFKIANLNIRDEDGRLFAFSSQDINDRTAGLIINFGNGEVESYRVATAAKFDERGISRGISMREALEILEINRTDGDDQPLGADAANDPAVQGSYGGVMGADGVEILTRFRGIQTSLDANPNARDRKFWAIIASAPVPAGVGFSDIRLQAGQNYSLQFVEDRDADGLFASVEAVYGSSDDNPDTDGDGINDFDEVRTGWLLGIPGAQRRVFSDPIRTDSDGDGVDDPTEMRYGTDPRQKDSDEDGLSDREELDAYQVILFDGDQDPSNNPTITVAPYTDAAIIEGGNGIVDTAVAVGSDDIQLLALGAAAQPGYRVIFPGPDGILQSVGAGDDFRSFGPTIFAGVDQRADTTATGDDVQVIDAGNTVPAGFPLIWAGLNATIDTPPAGDDFVQAGHERLFASDPLRRDTDGDGFGDGREKFVGANPNRRDAGSISDTDQDGLTDLEETTGWDVTVNGVTNRRTSDPALPDTDLDGLPDALEFALFTNPRDPDTDADGLNDKREYDPADPRDDYDDVRLAEYAVRCAAAANCSFTEAADKVGTSVLLPDTDGDTRSDGDEVLVSWLVTVVGQPSRAVFSDPLTTDGDGDNLDDLGELAAGTDPRLGDTDLDMVLDGPEVTRVITDDFGRQISSNPLAPDRLVKVEYTQAEALEQFDGGVFGNTSEWLWSCKFNVPGLGEFTGAESPNYPLESLDLTATAFPVPLPGFQGSGALGTVNQSLAFVVPENGSFRVTGAIIEEDWVNDPDPTREETGSFDEEFRMDGVQFGVTQTVIDVIFNTNRHVRVTATYTVYQ